MGLNGIGRANPIPGLEAPDGQGMSPRELLRHPDTAVVIVQAAILRARWGTDSMWRLRR